MKKCPYCYGDIHSDATKCRHCGEWLDEKKRKYRSDPHMTFYRTTIDLLTHYSTTRYWVFYLFFILSLLSAKEYFGSSAENETLKPLFAIGAYFFLLIAAIGNLIFSRFVGIHAETAKEIEDKKILESNLIKDEKFVKIEKGNRAKKKRYLILFNSFIWLMVFVYFVLLSIGVGNKIDNNVFLVLCMCISFGIFSVVLIWVLIFKVSEKIEKEKNDRED